jgi:hypothetical protein
VSDTLNDPEQLKLPFEEEARASSAKVFSLADHRQRVQLDRADAPPSTGVVEEISKELERQILDEVIKQAEQLPWYK